MRILVVEDDDGIRNTLEDILEFEDYYVHTEPNGHEALEWLKRNPRPSLIILDLMMPVMDGFDFRLEQLKNPDLATIPVIVITASKQDIDARYEFHQVILKPMTIEALAEAVKAIPIATDPRTMDVTKRFLTGVKDKDKGS